ncbi:hypothetical protein [Intrasporangium mesophilum]
MSHADGKSGTTGVLAATCLPTLVVDANTSAVSILPPAISEDTGSLRRGDAGALAGGSARLTSRPRP